MALENVDVIDSMGLEQASGALDLLIIDELDWSQEARHLTLLEEKLNRYLSFVESGEVKAHFEKVGLSKSANPQIRMVIIARCPLPDRAQEFFRHAEHVFRSAGFELQFRLFPE